MSLTRKLAPLATIVSAAFLAMASPAKSEQPANAPHDPSGESHAQKKKAPAVVNEPHSPFGKYKKAKPASEPAPAPKPAPVAEPNQCEVYTHPKDEAKIPANMLQAYRDLKDLFVDDVHFRYAVLCTDSEGKLDMDNSVMVYKLDHRGKTVRDAEGYRLAHGTSLEGIVVEGSGRESRQDAAQAKRAYEYVWVRDVINAVRSITKHKGKEMSVQDIQEYATRYILNIGDVKVDPSRVVVLVEGNAAPAGNFKWEVANSNPKVLDEKGAIREGYHVTDVCVIPDRRQRIPYLDTKDVRTVKVDGWDSPQMCQHVLIDDNQGLLNGLRQEVARVLQRSGHIAIPLEALNVSGEESYSVAPAPVEPSPQPSPSEYVAPAPQPAPVVEPAPVGPAPQPAPVVEPAPVINHAPPVSEPAQDSAGSIDSDPYGDDVVSPAQTAPKKNACGDGEDNDGDGDADYPKDKGCLSLNDDDETDVISPRGADRPIGDYVPEPAEETPVARSRPKLFLSVLGGGAVAQSDDDAHRFNYDSDVTDMAGVQDQDQPWGIDGKLYPGRAWNLGLEFGGYLGDSPVSLAGWALGGSGGSGSVDDPRNRRVGDGYAIGVFEASDEMKSAFMALGLELGVTLGDVFRLDIGAGYQSVWEQVRKQGSNYIEIDGQRQDERYTDLETSLQRNLARFRAGFDFIIPTADGQGVVIGGRVDVPTDFSDAYAIEVMGNLGYAWGGESEK